jgi:hypothetical protein
MSGQPQNPGMPPEIADLYKALQREVLSLHREWLMLIQVYGTSADRISLISHVAGTFFATAQRALHGHVLMSLFRLNDPPAHGKWKNLVLERLVDEVKAIDAQLAADMSAALARVRSLLEPYKELRDKVIAHNDLDTTPTLYEGTAKITGPSRETIETCLTFVREILNLAGGRYDHEATYWNPDFRPSGDGEKLIRHLRTLARIEGWDLGEVGEA